MKIVKPLKIILTVLFIFALFAPVYYIGRLFSLRITSQDQKIANLDTQLKILTQSQSKSFDSLTQNVQDLSKQSQATQDELTRREALQQKSQQDLLTAAVAKIGPSVVSIVVSKDVPKLQVTYQNPFGDDPYFKNFNFQIPVYTQNGTERQDIAAGTGFIIRANGYILTNKHVVADTSAYYTVLLSNGSQKTAQVVYLDPTNDIAILKITGSSYSPVTLGDSSTLALGQSVFAVGNALGQYNNSVSVGVISGLNRQISASDANGNTETLSGVVQTDAAINPGNSGGPLVNLDGQVVGINVATVQGSNNISFSIPINSVKSIIQAALK